MSGRRYVAVSAGEMAFRIPNANPIPIPNPIPNANANANPIPIPYPIFGGCAVACASAAGVSAQHLPSAGPGEGEDRHRGPVASGPQPHTTGGGTAPPMPTSHGTPFRPTFSCFWSFRALFNQSAICYRFFKTSNPNRSFTILWGCHVSLRR